MLRIIVISLVVANLLLLGFQSSAPTVKPEARPAPSVVKESGIPTIHLFSEMMQDQGLLSGNRRCFTIGPFHSVADWDDVHMRLQKVATRISERQTEALVEKGYWVYMPPYPSLLEANQALLSLQALGLEDVAIIYDGEWKNSVSLGYFMRQENAQRRKKALEDRGFKPKMRIQRQSEPRFWLDYEQEPGSGLVELDMQNRPNDFMQRPVPCPEAEFLETDAVASQDNVENPPQAHAPEEKASPVSAGDEKPVRSTEQPARAQDLPEESKKEADLEPGAGLDAGNTAASAQVNDDGKAAEAVTDVKTPSKTSNQPEETPVGDAEVEAEQVQANTVDQPPETPGAGKAEETSGERGDIEAGQVQATTADQAPETTTAGETEGTSGKDGETEADQAPATTADQTVEAPTPGEAVKKTGEGVETVSNEVLDEATGSGDQPAPVEGTGEAATTEVATPPKQAVGTGPVDMVSVEPGLVGTGIEGQVAENPAGGVPENETGDSGGERTDDGKEDTTAAPTGETVDSTTPEETEKDNGNGTVDGR